MQIGVRHGRSPYRPAVAAVELALLLPLLAFLFVITVDWARVFYYSITVTNCARQGALYASNAIAAGQAPLPSLQDVTRAALADAGNLSPQPTVQASTNGSTINVTVSWQFSTITNYPGVANPVNLSSTVTMVSANPQ
jgi:Flp pilus assembly protein TadG